MPMDSGIFRKKTLERISSPEQLSAYLRVTSPGIWVILCSVIIILAGLITWASFGTLETKAAAKAVVSGGKAKVIITSGNEEKIETGMKIRVASEDSIISDKDTDEYGRCIAYTVVNLPDGNYDAEIVVEEIHPIKFLFESR